MAREQPKDSDVDGWLGLLGDKERADVLKTRITEVEKTRRHAVEQNAASRRHLHATEGYHFVRGFFVVVLGILVVGASCVSYHAITGPQELARDRMKYEFLGVPPASITIPNPAAPIR